MSRHAFTALIVVLTVGASTPFAYDAEESRASSDIAITTDLSTLLMALPGPFKDGTIGFAGELKLLQFSLSAGFLKEPDSPTLLTLEAKVYPFDARLGRGPWLGVGFHGPREWTVSGSDWSYERETPARWWGLVGYSGYIGSNGLINIGVGAVRSRGNTKAAMHTSFGLRKRLPRH